MTRTAIYSLQDNALTEQPAMEKPILPVGDKWSSQFSVDYHMDKLPAYNAHVASLRTIPCHESARSLWKDRQRLEESRDYEVRTDTVWPDHWQDVPTKRFVAFPLPVKSEQGEKNHTGIFPVQRLTNGAGHSNLTIVTEEAITDIFIGSVLLVPFVNGYKDPKEVKVVVDDHGKPVATKLRTCIVTEYIFN